MTATTTTLDAKAVSRLLLKFDACDEARKWAKGRGAATAWAECPRGDWLLWLAGNVGFDRRRLVGATAACARLVEHLWPTGDDRPRKAVELVERWAAGDEQVSLCDLRIAADAAEAAAYGTAEAAASAAADAADAAASAAAYAAEAAEAAEAADPADPAYAAEAADPADAADAAAYAAEAAAYAAASAAASAAARTEMRAKTADLVRERIPFAVIEPLLIKVMSKLD